MLGYNFLPNFAGLCFQKGKNKRKHKIRKIKIKVNFFNLFLKKHSKGSTYNLESLQNLSASILEKQSLHVTSFPCSGNPEC